MSDYERKDDSIIARVEQKLDDHIRTQEIWNKFHDEKADIWREKLEKRFQPLEDLAKSATWSYKLVLGVAALVAALYKLFKIIHG